MSRYARCRQSMLDECEGIVTLIVGDCGNGAAAQYAHLGRVQVAKEAALGNRNCGLREVGKE